MRLLLAAPFLAVAASVHAHPGHGIAESSHWHASDAWGFLAAGVAVLLAIWFGRGGK